MKDMKVTKPSSQPFKREYFMTDYCSHSTNQAFSQGLFSMEEQHYNDFTVTTD